MSIITGQILWDLVAIVATFLAILIAYFKWSYQYWSKRNVPFIEPKIPFGCMENPLRRTVSLGNRMKQVYDEFKAKNVKHGGIYSMASPQYFLVDLDYVKNIMTKDFQYFVDRGTYTNEKDDPIGAHLFAIGGKKWRNLRTKLTPTFTSGKMKSMFQTVFNTGKILETFMLEQSKKGEPIDIKNILACYSTDIIGSCAFGLDCNTFKEPNSMFRQKSNKIFTSTKLGSVKNLFSISFPNLARSLRFRTISKDVSDFFTSIVESTVKYREENQIVRKDFLQLLMEIKNKAAPESEGLRDGNSLTMDEIVAQSFVFFLAGFETSSTTMTFALYELAEHPEIQDKVRKEINEVVAKHNGEITYDALHDMKYMGQVIDETLRKYPPLPFLTRVCVQDYKVPDSDVIIKKDTKVIIPILGIHYDPDYYPNPEVFDPERFSEENKASRHQYAHIPFGEGPRICIGLRFGIMQSKVGLAFLLKNFNFSINKKTQLPLKMATISFISSTEGGMWLDCTKIN